MNARCVLVVAAFSALLMPVAPSHAQRIVVFGDSWGVPAAPALQQVLIDHGLADTVAGAAVAGETAFNLSRPPGLQQITTDGDIGSSIRSNARIGYRLGPGQEISLSGGYSSAGLVSFATGGSGYDYTALIFGFNWVF